MADLAELCNVDERTIFNYIYRLESVELFRLISKKKGEGDHRYNVYEFPIIEDNCMILDPTFIEDNDLTAELKGVMLFIKANCIDGTNHFLFKSREELAKKIGVGKNSISSIIRELEKKGCIRIINHTLIITDGCFPLYLKGKSTNYIYSIIYTYCLNKGIEPPLKHKMCLLYLGMKYANKYTELQEDLLSKCKSLPKDVSLHYFCKALINQMPEKKPEPFFVIM